MRQSIHSLCSCDNNLYRAPSLLLTRLLSLVAVLEVKILVPGKAGLKVFFMKMGTPAETAGCIVFGWITFAPK